MSTIEKLSMDLAIPITHSNVFSATSELLSSDISIETVCAHPDSSYGLSRSKSSISNTHELRPSGIDIEKA
jgi:hypothetical protein